MNHRPSADPVEPWPDDYQESGFFFRPFLITAWERRRLIGVLVGGLAALYIFGAFTFFLLQPGERTASVEFRLTFDGADRGDYPNGSPFSRADIVSSPVLTEVFQRNELERYLTYEQFKNAMFVFESSRVLDLLNFEYQAKLADTRLPPVERAKVEAEYNQKLEALRVPQMSLRFVLSGTVASPPDAVMAKVLNDVLAVWAEQVAVQKGALKYQVQLLTPNVILKDTLNTQTMLIRFDLLRRHVSRVLSQLDRLADLPGANTVRAGDDKLSLLDLRTNLTDLLEFQLNPLIRRRLIYSLPPDEVTLNILYLEDRVLELQRFKDTADGRKGQLQSALQTFTSDANASAPRVAGSQQMDTQPPGGMAVAPQLGESFLDRIIDMAGRGGAMDYRKDLTNRIIAAGDEALTVEQDIAFYQETLKLLRAAAAGSKPGIALKPEEIGPHFERLQERVVDTLQLTNLAYENISTANLNPRSLLYRLTGPYSLQTARAVSLRYLGLMGVLVMAVGAVLILVGVLAFAGGQRFVVEMEIAGKSVAEQRPSAVPQLADGKSLESPSA
jgi:hypothetical protein